jgi:hypothetical protein
LNSQKTNTHREDLDFRQTPLGATPQRYPVGPSTSIPNFRNFSEFEDRWLVVPGMLGSPAAERPARLDTGFGYLTRSDSRAQAPHRPDVRTNPELNLDSFVSVLSVPVRHGEHYVIAFQGSKSGVCDHRHISSVLGKPCPRPELSRCFRRAPGW